MKIKVLAMVLSLSAVFSSIALGADKAPRKAKKSDRVTILDLSGPAEPESKLPAITDKGKL